MTGSQRTAQIEVGQKYKNKNDNFIYTVIGVNNNYIWLSYLSGLDTVRITVTTNWLERYMTLTKPKIVKYLNCYSDESENFLGYGYPTRDSADANSGQKRIARVRVEFEEGQFDE